MTQIPQVSAVETVPEYPGMIRIVTIDGNRWHYLADSQGVLELGRPYITITDEYRVHLFVPLQPYAMPRVLKVEQLA